MDFREFALGRTFVARAIYDSDLIEFLNAFAYNAGIAAASFTAIGALKNAKLGFYDQEKHKYMETFLSTPFEIASCIGNISIKDGMPFVHAHVILADGNSSTRGGHLLGGKVFAAEVHMTELIARKQLVRKEDEITGLSLWDL
jgi:predicted DNA-binding protein with PD1-like motif